MMSTIDKLTYILGAGVLAVFFSSGTASAQTIRPNPGPSTGGGGGGDPSCELTGGADCVMTGAIRADDTATAGGGVTYDGDTNMSMTRTAADTFGWFTDGTLRLTLSTSLLVDVDISLRSSSTTRGTISVGAASEDVYIASADASGGGVRVADSSAGSGLGLGVAIGARTNVAHNVKSGCFADTITATSGSNIVCAWGSGFFSIEQAHTLTTMADDGAGTQPSATTAPTSSYVKVTCNDASGCDYNPADTGAQDGTVLYIVSSGTNNVEINDTAGSIDVPGSTLTVAPNNIAICLYANSVYACR